MTDVLGAAERTSIRSSVSRTSRFGASVSRPRPGGLEARAMIPDRRTLGVRLLGAAVVPALLGAALSSVPGLGEVRSKLAGPRAGWLGVALALEVAPVLSFVVVFRGVLAERLPWRQSYH